MTDNPLRSPEDYELFLYTLSERFPSIQRSTLAFIRRGFSLARVTGELLFDHGLRLVVLERIVFDRLPAVIDGYGYEVLERRREALLVRCTASSKRTEPPEYAPAPQARSSRYQAQPDPGTRNELHTSQPAQPHR